MEAPNAQLPADDLTQIHALLRPQGKRVFRLDVSGDIRIGDSGRTAPDWGPDAFLEPEVATRAIRRGLSGWMHSVPGKAGRVWIRKGSRGYMQVARPGGDAADEAPFFIQERRDRR